MNNEEYEPYLYVITKNAAQCKKCNTVIESKHRHDYVSCSCNEISIDGGCDYLRRTENNFGNLIELSKCRKSTKEELNTKIMNMEKVTSFGEAIEATKYYRDLWYPPETI